MLNNLIKSKKIIIQGSSGSGKSTLSIELGKLLSLPVIHLDKEYWQPGWKKPISQEWVQKQLDFLKNDKWIIEGAAYQSALACIVDIVSWHCKYIFKVKEVANEKYFEIPF